MSTYIALLKFTAKGLQTVNESTQRAASFKAAAKKAGAKINLTFWTTGAYDGALVFDAPTENVASALMVSLGSLGNVQPTLLRAFDAKEFGAIVAEAPAI